MQNEKKKSYTRFRRCFKAILNNVFIFNLMLSFEYYSLFTIFREDDVCNKMSYTHMLYIILLFWDLRHKHTHDQYETLQIFPLKLVNKKEKKTVYSRFYVINVYRRWKLSQFKTKQSNKNKITFFCAVRLLGKKW